MTTHRMVRYEPLIRVGLQQYGSCCGV